MSQDDNFKYEKAQKVSKLTTSNNKSEDEDKIIKKQERWIFSESKMKSKTPTILAGINYEKELEYRQHAAFYIEELGQKLQFSQTVINTAIVYMQRFYMFHSFAIFHRYKIANVSLLLSAKANDKAVRIDDIIKQSNYIIFPEKPPTKSDSREFNMIRESLLRDENILIQTLGFELFVELPHKTIVQFCQSITLSKEFSSACYALANYSIQFTTFCLEMKPEKVATICVNLAQHFLGKQESIYNYFGENWFTYIDTSIRLDELQDLTVKFISILMHHNIINRIKPSLKEGIYKFCQSHKIPSFVQKQTSPLPYLSPESPFSPGSPGSCSSSSSKSSN